MSSRPPDLGGRPRLRTPGLLHVVSAVPPAVFVPADLAALAGPADLIELRLDLLPKDVPPAAWVAAAPRPVLATVRSRAQGGVWRHGPEAAAALLREAAAAGAAWIDVEEEVAPHLAGLPDGVQQLASIHGPLPRQAAWAIGDARYARIKLARPCDDASAFLALRAEVRAGPAHLFGVPYGRLAATRTLFAHDRAFLFGAASAEAAAAPGQPTLRVLLGELRAGEVDLDAEGFGLVGAPPARSPSPALHNAVFRRAQRNALYVPLPGLELGEALGLPFEGLSVTTPFKEAAWHAGDDHDDEAQATGVANTLVRTARGWSAYNTDVGALRRALDAAPDGDVFVYGAGGYARAALHAARQAGRAVRVAARVERAAYDLAQAFDVDFAGSSRYRRRPGDAVVLNATPAGADGSAVAAFVETDLQGLAVLDAPYAPPGVETGLVQQARAQGAAPIVDGRALLRLQAVAQARLFGASAEEAGASGGPCTTLVLVGPRGAGKTTLGARVAQAWGCPFVDTDAAVTRITGRTPARWIEEDGWGAFRAVERDALERALARAGIVVAAGAGCVEHADSRALLAAAPWVVHVDVGPACAAARVAADATARPRLPGARDVEDEARRAAEVRRPHYEALACQRVDGAVALPAALAALLALEPPPLHDRGA